MAAESSTGSKTVPPVVGWRPAVSLSLTNAYVVSSLVSADFNRDSIPDLAIGAASPGIWVLPGNGSGTFGTPLLLQAPSHFGYDLRVADLNADSNPDLVGVSRDGSLVSYLNHGNGRFTGSTNTTISPGCWGLALADFDQDRIIDLALPSPVEPFHRILRGQGDGNFVPGPEVTRHHNLRSIVSADFNDDGLPDLAVSRLHEGTISVSLGGASRTFIEIAEKPAVSCPGSMAIADFNRDGRPDLAVVNQNLDTVSVLLGRGDGRFHPAVSWAAGNLPTAIAAGDLNLDGCPDLAVANWQSADISILLGHGDGTFQSPDSRPVDREPHGVIIADFNQDGRPDLATCSRSQHSVSLVFNSPEGRPPPAPSTAPAPRYTRIAGPNDDYVITSWNTSHGLPQNTVLCLHQTRDGFLWVGTQHGLARFDGREFRSFDETTDPPLTNCHCLSLAEDTEGTLWVGSTKGLARFRKGRFEDIGSLINTPLDNVRSIVLDRGSVWFLNGSLRRH